jgi:predicted DNA-binding transcriptional regulator AlpA
MDELVGVAEIADLFGITRQGVDKLIRTRDDFPAPIAVITAGRIWEREAVEQWARETGRIE